MAESRRVLFVSTQMEAGGVQVRATSMLRALRAEGVPAELVFLYRKRGVFDNVPGVHAILDRKPSHPLDFLLILFRLFVHVRAFRPTAIVGFAHFSSPIATTIGALLGVKNRVGTQTNPPTSFSRIGRFLDFICGTYGIYTANITTSTSILRCFDHYPSRYKKTLRTVYNGIHQQASSMENTADARAAFGLDPDAFLLVNCGRLSAQKNQAFLLQIIEMMPNAKLAILGEGELRPDLEAEVASREIRDRVTFLGEVNPAKVPDFLRCGDVFLFPSRFEAFGLAVVEAMMAGLPVISSDYSALCEVIGDAGVLLPTDDPRPWVAAIEQLRLDAGAREQAGSRAIARASEFSFEVMLAGFKRAMYQK